MPGFGAVRPAMDPEDEEQQAAPPAPEMPGGQLDTEQLAAAATPSPAPGANDEVDQYLADNPVPPKEPQVEPPPAPVRNPDGTVNAQQTEAQILEQQGQNQAQGEQAVRAKGAAETSKLKEELDVANKEAEIKAQVEKDTQAAIGVANQRTQEWLDRYQTEAEKFNKMSLHDYWQDKSTGNKILAGIAMVSGAVGKGDNPGMQIINNAIERDFRLQTRNIERQRSSMEQAKEGYNLALTSKQQALADVNMKKAAALDSTAAQLVSIKLKQGIPLQQAQTDADVVALRDKANHARLETVQAIHRAQVDDARLQIEKERADAAALVAQARARKLKGGGGGGGGGAMAKFVEAAGKLKTGDPIPPELAVLGRQAGLKPNQVATEVDKYRNSAGKSAAGGVKAAEAEAKDIDTAVKEFKEQIVGTARTKGLGPQLNAVEAMREGLEKAIKSGNQDAIKAASVKAMEQAGTLMSGGKLTNAQIHILDTLKSSPDQWMEKWGQMTGQPVAGKGFLGRLRMLIDGAGDEMAEQIKQVREAGMNEFLGPGGMADTPGKKAHFLQRNTGMYSGLSWKGKKLFPEDAKAMAGGEGAAPASSGPSRAERARAILKDPAKKARLSDQELAQIVKMSQE